MRRQSSPYATSFSFGPGPMSSALKALIAANVVMFLATWVRPAVVLDLGLIPSDVIHRLRIWQLVTYMFLHGSVAHVGVNMLVLWMFGTEFERMWGTERFLKFYFIAGIGAGVFTVLFSMLPIVYA